uniref:Uncharacterized protein n=1 Tax=Aegilops tauschii subsp. strangulata TaxID=200361 RepID=A0A453HPB3_AEGTS
ILKKEKRKTRCSCSRPAVLLLLLELSALSRSPQSPRRRGLLAACVRFRPSVLRLLLVFPAPTSALPSRMEEPLRYKFGPYKIDAREVFHATPLTYAMVNLRPLLPGSLDSLFAPFPCLASRVLFAATIQCQSAAPGLESR